MVDFWLDLDRLLDQHPIVVERPRGSPHPASPVHIYPLDYGYLGGTQSDDGDAIDVWIGTLSARRIVGVACAVDGVSAQIETKLLIGCSAPEVAAVEQFFREMRMGCVVLVRDKESAAV